MISFTRLSDYVLERRKLSHPGHPLFSSLWDKHCGSICPVPAGRDLPHHCCLWRKSSRLNFRVWHWVACFISKTDDLYLFYFIFQLAQNLGGEAGSYLPSVTTAPNIYLSSLQIWAYCENCLEVFDVFKIKYEFLSFTFLCHFSPLSPALSSSRHT